MNFKELVAQDNKRIFLNPDEFGEQHKIDGKEMLIIIDNYEEIEREKRMSSNVDGIFLKQILFYVTQETFGENLPVVGRVMRVDNKSYTVTDAINEDGVYSISLRAVKS